MLNTSSLNINTPKCESTNESKGCKVLHEKKKNKLQHSPPYLVLFQVGLNLRFASSAISGLIDWQQNHFVVVGQHCTVQSTVDSTHIFSCELSEFVEALVCEINGEEIVTQRKTNNVYNK